MAPSPCLSVTFAGTGLAPPVASPMEHAAHIVPVKAMGLTFSNPLGLAAGFDRTGALIPTLAPLGFGHIEVGTVSPQTAVPADTKPASTGVRIGVNIGSARRGLDERVIADYAAAFRRVAAWADYVVANLSSPFAERDGNSDGVDLLIRHLCEVRDGLSTQTRRRVPLLVKVEGGPQGSVLPAAIAGARRHGLDGIVLVSSCVRRISEVSDYLTGAAVIAVGEVATAEDFEARIAAGAALVQIYTAFVRGGSALPRRILSGFQRRQ